MGTRWIVIGTDYIIIISHLSTDHMIGPWLKFTMIMKEVEGPTSSKVLKTTVGTRMVNL